MEKWCDYYKYSFLIEVIKGLYLLLLLINK